MTGTIHATTIAIDGHGVLIEGPSGSGKSDLAMRLIDRGAVLVADDRTMLVREADRLLASAPETIAGRIEVRGIGIVAMPHIDDVPLALVVTLGGPVERMPEEATRTIDGVAIPHVRLDAREPSAAIKVEIALRERGLR